MLELVVASNNKNKLREIREILKGKFIIYSLQDLGIEVEVVEDGETFYQNALKKARTVSALTDKVALADDSGLMVDALNGAPGVYSARYAGEGCNDRNNNAKLLQALQGVQNRTAQFISSIVLFYPNGKIIATEGTVCGTILHKEVGSAGFGYDPLFFSTELGMSFGEATAEQKNAISHRGRALMALVHQL